MRCGISLGAPRDKEDAATNREPVNQTLDFSVHAGDAFIFESISISPGRPEMIALLYGGCVRYY